MCLVAIVFHLVIGFRGPQHVTSVELGLAVYGAIAAVLALRAGGLMPSDKAWLWCCALVYLMTLAWVMLVPSLN
jgi:hypothetical protein